MPEAIIGRAPEPTNVHQLLHGVEVSRTWRTDSFRASPEKLIAAGIISRDQLASQPGREGRPAVFLPDGTACPLYVRGAWRQPDYKTVFLAADGKCTVEITVSTEEQRIRRKAEREAEAEALELELNKELAAQGSSLIPRELEYRAARDDEIWTGTKAQLQAAGIGVGIAFPGERGTPTRVHCKCPLGFPVAIRAHWEKLKAAAGIFDARSPYLDDPDEPESTREPLAFGVTRQAVGIWYDVYRGTADALIAARIVSSLSLFPGQPGRGKIRCSYDAQHRPRRGSASPQPSDYSISRGRSGCFEVSVHVDEQETERRKSDRSQFRATLERKTEQARAERVRIRKLAQDKPTPEKHRAKVLEDLECMLQLTWNTIRHSDGLHRLDVSDGSEAYDAIADAFDSIREAVQSAGIDIDAQAAAECQRLRGVQAAKRDRPLQSFLRLVVNNTPAS